MTKSKTPKLPLSMSGGPSFQMDPKEYEKLQAFPGNLNCIDCGASKPDWGSPKLGILFCFQCSGRHRGLGTHVSFVRSVTMDSWSEKEMAKMRIGGNTQCKEFLTKHGVDVASSNFQEKYDTPAAELYRQVLSARVEGKPEPTELPKPSQSSTKAKVDPSRLQGFGSGPPPPNSGASGNGPEIWIMAAVTIVLGVVLWFAWGLLL